MNTRELLGLAEPIFGHIDKLIKAEKYNEVYELIEASEPPSKWILELPSKSDTNDTYKTLPIDLMEASMRRIFGEAGIERIGTPVISQDKNKFAVTVVVTYKYKSLEGRYHKYVDGIASVAVNDLMLIELASPKASTMAVKNAIKQLGGLFGKYLNRPTEELDFPADEPTFLSPEEMAKDLASRLIQCKTYEELKSYRLVVYDKKMPLDLQNIYETRLRELAGTAKSIG